MAAQANKALAAAKKAEEAALLSKQEAEALKLKQKPLADGWAAVRIKNRAGGGGGGSGDDRGVDDGGDGSGVPLPCVGVGLKAQQALPLKWAAHMWLRKVKSRR